MSHVAVPDRPLEGPDDVGLAPQLAEPAGPEPPVEGDKRLVLRVRGQRPGHLGGGVHDDRAYRCA